MNIIKKLPKIYQNDINKPIKNNRQAYYSGISSNKNDFLTKMTYLEISSVLDSIFSGMGHAFNIPVVIKTNTKLYDTFLIARTGDVLLTFDRDRINVEDIVYIKRKNP